MESHKQKLKKNLKRLKLIGFNFLFIFVLGLQMTWAQSRAITGKIISSEDNEPVPGVNVIIGGTSSGTVTDVNGDFSIPFSENAKTLVLTCIGYQSRTIEIAGRTNLDITLMPDTRTLSEVVVTALGLEREKRALGYATQEVKGDDMDKAREVNIVNSLAGRVAGVNIRAGASGAASTSRIVIRGESSLSGDNQPLFVVDGIPINNRTFGAAGNNSNMGVDYGNGAADINPDDVESITVLKGPNAAALYGSRAANGVILITTKSGKDQRGLGVTVNSTSTFESPLRLWRYQDQFGVGSNFEFEYANGMGGGLNDFIDESWGPRMDGRPIKQHSSPTTGGFRGGDVSNPERGDIIASPFLPQPNGIRDFYETGRTFTNNVSISGSNDNGHFRLSYTNLHNEGILPNTGLKRNTIAFSAGYKPINNLSIDLVANYVNSASDNIKNHGYGTESVEYTWIWWGRSVDVGGLREYWQHGFEGTEQFNFNYNWNDNPYFTMYENTNGFNRDRLFGNIKINYDITNKWSLMLRSGTDLSNDIRNSRRAYSSQRFPFGMYKEDRYFFNELNTDFLLTYNNDDNTSTGFAYRFSAGANRMDQTNKRLLVSANQLSIPGVYSLNNTRIPLEFDQYNARRRINSVFAFGQFSFRNYLFLDLTARNDWSSTLPPDNNSYFYPSATFSAVISDMTNLGETISFAKLRAGWSQVGSDTDPFRLANYFNFAGNWGAIQTAGEAGSIANANLKPEVASSFEIGTDIRFFNDRLGVDLTYYNTNSRNQILSVPVSRASGYTSRFLNAGLINSYGVEAMINVTPVATEKFKWTSFINWSMDRTYVRELAEGLEVYELPSQFTSNQARIGERMGDVYGVGILRAEDGRPIYNQSGFPIRSNELAYLGNYNPDFMLGWQNTLTYKNLQLGFLFDLSYGGVLYSRTYLIAHTTGVHANTANREGQFVGDGWVRNADGSLSENTSAVSGRDYYWSHYNRNNIAEGTFDATYLKLRELRLGYSLPNKYLGARMPFRNITASVVGRNLFLWTKEIKDFDPETFSFSGENIIPGIENTAMPTTRSIGFNLNFEF